MGSPLTALRAHLLGKIISSCRVARLRRRCYTAPAKQQVEI